MTDILYLTTVLDQMAMKKWEKELVKTTEYVKKLVFDSFTSPNNLSLFGKVIKSSLKENSLSYFCLQYIVDELGVGTFKVGGATSKDGIHDNPVSENHQAPHWNSGQHAEWSDINSRAVR